MENESTPNFFKLEKSLCGEGYEIVIGVDEAGRGPLAGPVVSCAVALRNLIPSPALNTEHPLPITGKGDMEKFNLIRDSKMLSEKQRESLYDFICENFHVGVGICDHKTIDRINILEATYLAMRMAIASLSRSSKLITRNAKMSKCKVMSYELRAMRSIILVDGNKKIPNLSIEQRAIVSGDKIVKSISAASIIAKVTRDRIMRECHKKYPAYEFDKHKGYGTALHMEKLKKYGACEIHRKSFGPVRKVTSNQ